MPVVVALTTAVLLSTTGINLYNFGVGDIGATLLSGSITAGLSGVNAFAQGGGNVTIDNRAAINAGAIGINAGNGTSNALVTVTVTATFVHPLTFIRMSSIKPHTLH